MSYRLGVGNREFGYTWSKFIDKLMAIHGLNTDEEAYVMAIHILSEYNGKDIRGTNYIEFENEEDAVVFKLRYLT